MSESNKTYTYRAGEKIELDISPDQMVVRALLRELNDPAIINEEQVSSGSTRITTSALIWMPQWHVAVRSHSRIMPILKQ